MLIRDNSAGGVSRKLALLMLLAGHARRNATFLSPQSAEAASATWTGATDAVWPDANWGGVSPVPGSGDTATFNAAGNGNTTISLSSEVTINTILFDTANAAAYTIGSGGGRSQISIATGRRGFREENLSGSPKAEALAGAVVE